MTIVSKISFAFVFLLAALHLKAQHYVSVSFEQTPFGKCIEEFEKQTSLTFYYDKADTDSIRVTLTAKAALLEEVLDQILKPENLEFSLYNNQVFISKGRKILTFISAAPTEVNQKNTEFDYSEFLQRDDFQKKAEDKLYVIGYKSKSSGPSARIIGSVKDQKTGESLVGASIFVKKGAGASTDPFGNFSLVLPIGRHKLNIQSVGMKSTFRNIQLYSDGSLSIEMTEDVISLKEVSVNASRENKVADVRMGVDKLDIKTVRQLPFSLGETDVLKAILVLPGVQTVGEGTLGFNVRGGNSSQNLILYNDAVIYNPSHLFGFFSTFNADMIKSVELLKSGIPAEYGGRLSSVLEVVSREGNLKKFSGAGGISPVTARLTLETPIIKDKSSLLVGFRTTYSDWILKRLESSTFRNSSGSFYDLAINYSHKINDKNNLALSGYSSQDQFKLRSDTSFQYKNLNYSAKWKSILSPKLFAVFTGAYSQYDFSINSDASPVNAFTLNYSIKQIQGKADFNYSLNSKHTISYGLSVIRYAITPGNLLPKGNESLIVPDRLPQEQALESAGYIGDNIEVNPRLTVNAGLRYSLYQYLGPRDVYVYDAGLPKELGGIRDTVRYGASKSIATYHGLEPRLSARFLTSANSSLKMSYNRMRQYIQMLSNTAAVTPTDIWKLSDTYLPAQIGDQFSIGFYKNLKGGLIETSVEAYYKTIQQAVDFRGGAALLQNRVIETQLAPVRGKAYGIEFLIKKTTGKLNGWLSYTYSRSFFQTTSPFSSETINNGKYYPSNFDKPHAVNFIGNYKLNRRCNVSLNFVYSTGRPVTLPVARYTVDGINRIFYSERNQFRIPDYIRTDLSLNVEGNHKVKKLAHSSWTFAIYNLFGRQNAYSVFFTSVDGVVKGYQLSIFARPIATVTYNFRF